MPNASGDSSREVVQLLDRAGEDFPDSIKGAIPLIYESLRDRAAALMLGERASHTLGATAVVHEALIKLIRDDSPVKGMRRRELVEVATAYMRYVLASHARARRAAKRGGGAKRLPLDESLDAAARGVGHDAQALTEALERFTARFPRAGQVVSLRYFFGLTVPEVAERLEVSTSTVEADFRLARAWLRRELEREA